MPEVTALCCWRCGTSFSPDIRIDSAGCRVCAATAPSNVHPMYATPGRTPQLLLSDNTLWRYHAQLPVARADAISLGEGLTPLLPAPALGELLGIGKLLIKDEGRNPTHSHKDRFSTVAVSVAKARGRPVVATASSGNAGASLAAYANRAGIDCVVASFGAPSGPMFAQIRKLGARLVFFSDKLERWRFLAQAADERDWMVMSPFRQPATGSHPIGIEGYKTLAYEIVDQLDGEAPDWCVLPVCYGDALAGMWRGFLDLVERGHIPSPPRLAAAELHGSLGAALGSGADLIPDMPAQADILAPSIGATRSTFQALAALRHSRGAAVTVGSDRLIAMQETLARAEGLFAELAAVAPFEAIRSLVEGGVISPSERVVAVMTASGMKDLDRSCPIEPDFALCGSAEDGWQRLESVG